MTWNYRRILMDMTSPNDKWYEIHEVYYTEKGKVKYWTRNPVQLVGNTKKEILAELKHMAKAMQEKPLKESKLPKHG